MTPRRMLVTLCGITAVGVIFLTVYSPENVYSLKKVLWVDSLPNLRNWTYDLSNVVSVNTPNSSFVTTVTNITTSVIPTSTSTTINSTTSATFREPTTSIIFSVPATNTKTIENTTSAKAGEPTTTTTAGALITRTTTSALSMDTTTSILTTSSSASNSTPTRFLLTSRFIGRLGNQMFIYATLLGLARAQDREPFMGNGGDLESLFKVSHMRKDIKTDGWSVMGESKYATFDSKFMKLPQQNMIISGYLQCWRYFQHAQEEIRQEYIFKDDIQKKVQTILSTYRGKRQNHVLVGVHIRRGDFLNPGNVKYGYGVANASYFVNAFTKMRSLLTNQNITFLLGSDDLDWCKNNLNDSEIEVLPQGSFTDHFAILSSCDHAIISGGTYGWWIGWLANGVTIYYKHFITKNSPVQGGFNDPDYYPLGWIGLEN